MNGLLQSQVFFVISSIGFVLLWIFIAIILVYFIRITRTFWRIMDKVDQNINSIGDTTKELLGDLRNSTLFSFFVRKKRKARQDKEEEKE